MAVICDGCGTKDSVRRAYITLWNGNIIDLCRKCMTPFSTMLDDITQVKGHFKVE